jgi:hypothetical protein
MKFSKWLKNKKQHPTDTFVNKVRNTVNQTKRTLEPDIESIKIATVGKVTHDDIKDSIFGTSQRKV